MTGQLRTEFRARPGNLTNGFIATGVGVLAFGAAAALHWLAGRTGSGLFLLPLAVLFTAGGVAMLVAWGPRYRLVIGGDGIELRTRGRRVFLPWDDIEHWWVGVPPDFLGRQSKRDVIMAIPAEQVADPAAGERSVVWSRRRRRWAICEPALTDGSTEEIVAALNHFASDRRTDDWWAGSAAADRRLHGTRAAVGAGSVRTEFGPADLLFLRAAADLVFGAALLWVGASLYLSVVDVSAAAAALGSVIFGVLSAAFLIEAGYLLLLRLPGRRLVLDADGITLARGRSITALPWAEIGSWGVSVDSRWYAFPANVFTRPRAREVLYAVPSARAGDPAAHGAFWSARRRVWVVCKPAQTDGTTHELVAAMNVFAADKRAESVQR